MKHSNSLFHSLYFLARPLPPLLPFSDKLVALHVFDSAKYCDKKFPVALRHDKIRSKFETLMVGSVCVWAEDGGAVCRFRAVGFLCLVPIHCCLCF